MVTNGPICSPRRENRRGIISRVRVAGTPWGRVRASKRYVVALVGGHVREMAQFAEYARTAGVVARDRRVW